MTRDYATPRVRGFGTSVFSEMSRLANQHNAVNLGQGFPDFAGPPFVKEAAKAAIDADLN
nr:aminotransferase [Chloroflexia bacterium]